MKIGTDSVRINALEAQVEYTYHYSKKTEDFAVDIPEKYVREGDQATISQGKAVHRIRGKSHKDCREKFVEYMEDFCSIESLVVKMIWYEFEGHLFPPSGMRLGDDSAEKVWEDLLPAVEFGIRFGHHHHRGVSLADAGGSKISTERHSLSIAWSVMYVVAASSPIEKDRFYLKDDKGVLHREYRKFSSGVRIPYEEAIEDFFTTLCEGLDNLTASAARWLMKDGAHELMRSGANLLGEAVNKEES